MKIKKHKDFLIENNKFNTLEEMLQSKGLVFENGYWNSTIINNIIIGHNEKELLIKDGKLLFKFGTIKGSLFINGFTVDLYNLTSVEGLPLNTTRLLDISGNNLTSLEGIGTFRNLDTSNNNLTSLEGLPEEINGYLDVSRNNITSLEGGPIKIHNRLDVSHNKLTNLKGAPYTTLIFLNKNNIETLKGVKDINTGIRIGVNDELPKEEKSFIEYIINNNIKIDDYIIELVDYIINSRNLTHNILNLKIDDTDMLRLPKNIQNLFSNSKTIRKFNI